LLIDSVVFVRQMELSWDLTNRHRGLAHLRAAAQQTRVEDAVSWPSVDHNSGVCFLLL